MRTAVRSSSTPRLRRWANGIASAARRQWSDPLSRGGLALLINTGLTGVLGFGYWIIAARLFSTYAVGVAGALVAATTLFSGIGQLNLSGMLMRFLPKAGGKSRRLVLTTYVFAASASALLAVLSLAVIKIFASPTSPLRLTQFNQPALVLAAAAMAIFTIEDNVLVGLRRAVWVPVENGAFGIAKIVTLFMLAPIGTAFALFSAWMIPLTLTIPVISAVLFFRFLPSASRPRRTAHLGPEFRSENYPLRDWRCDGRSIHADLDISSADPRYRLIGRVGQCLVLYIIPVLKHDRPSCRQLRVAVDSRGRSRSR